MKFDIILEKSDRKIVDIFLLIIQMEEFIIIDKDAYAMSNILPTQIYGVNFKGQMNKYNGLI
jgi:hypothetical protein